MKSTRVTIFFLLLFIGSFLGLAGRCFYLQYYRNEHYSEICLKQQRSFQFWQPQRGVILDCRGRVLAASNQIQTVFAEPRIARVNTLRIDLTLRRKKGDKVLWKDTEVLQENYVVDPNYHLGEATKTEGIRRAAVHLARVVLEKVLMVI